jgi:hypothetical protein
VASRALAQATDAHTAQEVTVSDTLRTHNADRSGSAGSHPVLSRALVVVVTVLVTGIASAVPVLAQAQTPGLLLDTTDSSTTNPDTSTDPDRSIEPNDSTDPDVSGTSSDTSSANPDANTTDAASSGNGNTSTDRDAGTSDPDANTSDPGTKGGQPNSTGPNDPSNRVPAVEVVPAADDGGPSVLLLLLIALAALLVGAVPARVVARRILRRRRRIGWQLQARREPPRRPCRQRNHYCQKTSINLKPGRRDIAYLEFHARNGDVEELDTRASTRLVDELNRALVAYRHDRKLESLRARLLSTAGLLVEEIESWLQHDVVEREITTEAHLTAAEVEYEFTLYRCSKKQDGPAWEKEDEWQASLDDEEDQEVARLHRPRPVAEDAEGLSAQLADFVRRVDVRPTVELSSKPSMER